MLLVVYKSVLSSGIKPNIALLGSIDFIELIKYYFSGSLLRVQGMGRLN